MKKNLLYFVIFLVLFSGWGGTFLYSKSNNLENNTSLNICSFNIQFLGSSKKRDNETLSKILKDYDIVVVQELVASPVEGTYPDGKPYSADHEAALFFQCMKQKGFSYILSEEDTGPGEKNHSASNSTEWWVVFYKPEVVEEALDIPHGFLAEDRSHNDDYDRVPYTFPFRTKDNHLDFVLISVHLKPGNSRSNQARRFHELSSIAQWIDRNDKVEKDFIVLGDMNIKNKKELLSDIPRGYVSLNDECYSTNTNPKSPKPYDHIMYNPVYTTEIESQTGILVINLVKVVRPYWTSKKRFPGDPYVHNKFRQYYSDHDPVVFKMNIPENDDD